MIIIINRAPFLAFDCRVQYCHVLSRAKCYSVREIGGVVVLMRCSARCCEGDGGIEAWLDTDDLGKQRRNTRDSKLYAEGLIWF